MPFFPNTNDDVSQFLRDRSAARLHISGNDEDRSGAETISLSHLDSVLLYEPEEMIISAQVGIPLEKLRSVLAAKGQWIPTLAAEESLEHTLGAAIATDHFHPRTHSCGALRTTVLGGTFCTTEGEIFKSGSRVVKSVAGYDIHRAFCGSQGFFGVILDLIMKVRPLPEQFFRFLAPLDSRERLLQFHPSCLEEFSGKLLVELSGYQEDLSADIEQLKSGKLPIVEELDDKRWADAIKELIHSKDTERRKALSAHTDELLKNVRRVFDPEGVLI
jgi:glycolate oxidase FAD binding subunit